MILAQLADPQIGFQNYEAELQRFRNEINLIQQSDCQVAVICGDLMHHVNRESLEVYLQELKKLTIPVYHVPGNHDTGSVEGCAAYKDLIGPLYYAVDLPDPAYRLIILDTSLWMEGGDPVEGEKMEHFFLHELASGKKIIIASHVPVFAENPDEDETYFNLPVDRRKWLLPLLKVPFLKTFHIAIRRLREAEYPVPNPRRTDLLRHLTDLSFR